jgi:hypothetical protein
MLFDVRAQFTLGITLLLSCASESGRGGVTGFDQRLQPHGSLPEPYERRAFRWRGESHMAPTGAIGKACYVGATGRSLFSYARLSRGVQGRNCAQRIAALRDQCRGVIPLSSYDRLE